MEVIIVWDSNSIIFKIKNKNKSWVLLARSSRPCRREDSQGPCRTWRVGLITRGNIWWRHGRDKEAERFMRYGKTQKGRNEDGEEWADVGSLLATWGHGDIWARLLRRTMSDSGPTIARVCVNVHGSCCHGKPCRFQWVGLPPRPMFGSIIHTAAGAIPIWVAFAITWDHGGNQA